MGALLIGLFIACGAAVTGDTALALLDTGIVTDTDTDTDTDTTTTFGGAEVRLFHCPGAALGTSLVGDTSGDGTADILLNGEGDAIVVQSVPLGAVSADTLTTISTLESTDTDRDAAFGVAGDGIGDVNGDGYDDILIGNSSDNAPGQDWGGAAYLFLGPLASAVTPADAAGVFYMGHTIPGVTGNDWDAQGGRVIESVSDFDGDGVGDALVGAPAWPASAVDWGAVYLVSGAITGTLDATGALAIIEGNDDYDAGTSLGGAGRYLGNGDQLGSLDHNGDGLSDVVVMTAGGEDGALVFDGPHSGVLSVDDATRSVSDELIGQPEGGTDLTGDGYEDLLIGRAKADDAAGGAVVVAGPLPTHTEADDVIAAYTGTTAGDKLGLEVEPIGDQNGDGSGDFVLASNVAGDGRGAVVVVSNAGEGTHSLADVGHRFDGFTATSGLGWDVDGGADIDGDGQPDFFASAIGEVVDDRTGVLYAYFGTAY